MQGTLWSTYGVIMYEHGLEKPPSFSLMQANSGKKPVLQGLHTH